MWVAVMLITSGDSSSGLRSNGAKGRTQRAGSPFNRKEASAACEVDLCA